MDEEEDEELLHANFVQWLVANGAKFPKLQWPSYNTMNSSPVRGVIATDNIISNEIMLEIPCKLLMCEPNFHHDPLIGQLITENIEILPGDLSLCIFIMNELTKKEFSFYYPYLRILPKGSNNSILEWTREELDMFQV